MYQWNKDEEDLIEKKKTLYFSNVDNQHAVWMNSKAIKLQWCGDSREGWHS